jgi:hypothetical protein
MRTLIIMSHNNAIRAVSTTLLFLLFLVLISGCATRQDIMIEVKTPAELKAVVLSNGGQDVVLKSNVPVQVDLLQRRGMTGVSVYGPYELWSIFLDMDNLRFLSFDYTTGQMVGYAHDGCVLFSNKASPLSGADHEPIKPDKWKELTGMDVPKVGSKTVVPNH